MGKKGNVKGLVLSSVFRHCYDHQRGLTVSELLANDPLLMAHYGRRPQVLSNTLRRYYKLGLLSRKEEVVIGHPYRYNLTEKGFNRLVWMATHHWKYFDGDKNLLIPLMEDILRIMENRRSEMERARAQRIKSLMEQIAASQRRYRMRIMER